MNNYRYENEAGRSMIEMLGVLAIIGVLSVGGIAGYSKAMNKFKTNQVADNVSMLVANIKTLYAQQNSYTGLNNISAVKMGVVPDELTGAYEAGKPAQGGNAAVAASQGLENAFNGKVYIGAADSKGNSTSDDLAFYLIFNGLSKEACVTLATNDWGSSYSSGLIGMKVDKAEMADADDKSLMYAPFQCMAQYFLNKGYVGIKYKSTVCTGAKDIVLFDKTMATPVGPIQDFII